MAVVRRRTICLVVVNSGKQSLVRESLDDSRLGLLLRDCVARVATDEREAVRSIRNVVWRHMVSAGPKVPGIGVWSFIMAQMVSPSVPVQTKARHGRRKDAGKRRGNQDVGVDVSLAK